MYLSQLSLAGYLVAQSSPHFFARNFSVLC
jgi:hypothetical protein